MKLMIYGAGGTGTNILAQAAMANQAFGNLEVDTAYIDTSLSNATRNIDPSKVYIVEGKSEGSGKMRTANAAEIKDAVPSILLKHAPGDFNIVLSSTSGGTGSVAAPYIVSELLARDKIVVVLSVGSVGSKREVENGIKTLQSYSKIASARNKPVVMGYYQNSHEGLVSSKVDQFIKTEINALASLFSLATIAGTGLDITDLRNWLDCTLSSGYPPRLLVFTVLSKKNATPPAEFKTIVSVATVSDSNDTAVYSEQVDYHCTGLMADPSGNLGELVPMHYVVADGYFDEVAKELDTNLKMLEQRADARRFTKGVLDDHSSATDDIVL